MASSRRLGLRGRVPTQNTQSLLLGDYRDNRYQNLQLTDIFSHVVEFSCDHEGSKFIQRKLDEATVNRKEAIFRECRRYLVMLMTDTFGNFVMQKFLEIGTEQHRYEILTSIQRNFMMLSHHKYGCRVVQKAIEISGMAGQSFLLQCLDPDEVNHLAKDSNGNHVIQKCFRCVPVFIQDVIFGHLMGRQGNEIFSLCFDLYGCRVIQFILAHGTNAHRAFIFGEICSNPRLMIQDRYGNYVIQRALLKCSPPDINSLAQFIVENLVLLAQQKYASNVVEKCLDSVSWQIRELALQTICNLNSEDIKKFCIDAYANYVVQKLINVVDIDQVKKFNNLLQPFFCDMQRHVCGRKIIELLTERITES